MPSIPIAAILTLAGKTPLFQALAIILGTFILEDAATVLAAMQAQDGTIPVALALGSLYVGIVLGDIGLYGLGRAAAYVPWVNRWLPPRRQEMVRAWVDGRVFNIVFVSRFIPGLRLPTYTTCGFVGADLRRFALAALIATMIWTSLLFALSLKIGQILMVHLGTWRWAGAIGFVAFVIFAGRMAASGLQASRR
jgi:membrane protein DedA with SNARE-associated domain